MNAVDEMVGKRVYYRYEEIDPGVDTDSVEILDKTGFEEEVASLPSIEALAGKDGFWLRRFQGASTAAQRKFDWCLGVMLPLVCFYFDPFIFRTPIRDQTFLGDYKTLVYVLAFCSVMGTAAFLLWGERLRWLNGILAGLFLAASAVSFVVGIAILPYSLLGMIVLIGFLGLVPFFTSFVMLRNAFRAMQSAEPFFDRPTLRLVTILIGAASLIVPYLMNKAVN